MRLLLTGGAGYLGTSLADRLTRHPAVTEVVVYDNLVRGNYDLFLGRAELDSSKIRFIKGDILDSRKLREVMPDIDIVFHLAAKVTTPFADHNPHEFEQVNHWGTAELVYAVEDSPVRHFVHVSSLSVYDAGPIAMDINTPPDPKSYYGISKRRGEEHVERLAEKIPVHIIRCGNIYGYNRAMRFDGVINKFMFQANFKQPLTVDGDGQHMRTFVHIDSAADCLGSLITSGLPPATYNLALRQMRVVDIIDQMREIFPDLETIFLSQHTKLQEQYVQTDDRLSAFVPKAGRDFVAELKEFRQHFSFGAHSISMRQAV